MLSRTALCINNRMLPKTLQISQNVTCRSMHVICRIGNSKIQVHSLNKLSRYSPAFSSAFIRGINTDKNPSVNINHDVGTQTSSTEIEQVNQTNQGISTTSLTENISVDAASSINLIDKIPDAPVPPPTEALETLTVIGEASFESIGLGGWTPVGMVQQMLEWVHVGCGIPWWGTIAIGTICVRTILFPLVIVQQKNAAAMHNSLPGMQKIQERLTEARNEGDQIAAAQTTQELLFYMKENNCSPFKNLIVPICQMPLFISFFMALRGMANLPVDSMRTGGIYWFADLTIPDPYYILPVMTSLSLALTMKLGIDGPKLASLGMLRYVFQAIPIVIFPFSIGFPAAIVWYWTSTNLFSTMQVALLRIPKVRTFFGIPAHITHAPNAVAPQKKFKEGFKESWTNMKLAREMTDRQQLDRIQFNKAGRGPIEKTYAYNPIKEHLKKEILAKKGSR